MHNIQYFFKQDFGTIWGFCTSIAIFVIVIKILVKIEVREKVDSIDIEDEDWKANEEEHREYAKLGMAALSIGNNILTPLNFSVCAWQNIPVKCFKICHILYSKALV